MNATKNCGRAIFFLLAATTAVSAARAQSWELDRCTDVVVPQTRSFAWTPRANGVELVEVRASVKLLEQTASTTLEIELVNRGAQQAEAVLLLPVPDGAAVSSFDFDGHAAEPTAQVLPRDEARRLYDAIVNRIRDPALLEFAGFALVRSSLFPVAPNARQRVRLTYEHLLPADGGRVDYVLPRSESLAVRTPWQVHVEVRSRAPIACVYSPSHELVVARVDANHVDVKLAESSRLNPGPFRLSCLREVGELSASLFAYPDPKVGGGWFLLMAGLPAATPDERKRIARELTIVIDRSGSMAGPKMDQARAAALQVVEGLADGEAFNVVDFSTTVSLFANAPVRKNRETTLQARQYLEALRPSGGTNLYDALNETLRQPHESGLLPIVLFLTDGIPTVRNTSEPAIRERVERGNVHHRRCFTFGVGADVNAPLLDRIARDVIPSNVPDRFDGDTIVVLGQYVGDEPLHFRVSGDHLGQPREFRFDFELDHATTRNAFVPRLWATRRIAYLVDQVRELGAALTATPSPSLQQLAHDPRFKELTDEILRLSTEFGILTEYTSFLATDGVDLGSWRELTDACSANLEGKAVKTRDGVAAVAQGCNFNDRKGKQTVDYRNGFVDEKLARVESATCQQLGDRAFFRSGERWIDARLIAANGKDASGAGGANGTNGAGASSSSPLRPDDVVEFGSDAHRRLLDELVAEGRQAVLSLRGDVLLEHRGRRLLVHNDGRATNENREPKNGPNGDGR